MPKITNDQELKSALDKLPDTAQRAIGLLFANNIHLPEARSELAGVLELALESDYDEAQCAIAYRTAKSIATSTYTACGHDTDWEAQAEHFVAAACSAALTPRNLLPPRANPAWKAAIQSRMANNCLMMTEQSATIQNEAQKQYEICEEFLLTQA